jgi:MbtH protein
MSWQDSDREGITNYKIDADHEDQYSIWLEFNENPRLWKDAEDMGPKIECLSYIKKVWDDMRPISILTERLIPLRTKLSYILSFRQKRVDNDDSISFLPARSRSTRRF